MPIYEYRCIDCGKQFEAFQRIVEPPLKECPSCHQEKLERLVSQTSFVLKGGGWYQDGYGSAAPEKKQDSSAKSSSSNGSSSSGKAGSDKT